MVSKPQLQTSTKTVTDVNGGLARPGDVLRYDIVIKNIGNTYATNVTVDDPLDVHLEDPVAAAGGVVEGAWLRWNATTTPALAQVAPGADVTLSFTARIRDNARSGDVISNQAVIKSAEGIEVRTDDPGTPEIGDATLLELKFPDLTSAVKAVSDVNGGDVEPGDELVWLIALRNEGTMAATQVRCRTSSTRRISSTSLRSRAALSRTARCSGIRAPRRRSPNSLPETRSRSR